jgi:hypothetical protein
MLSLSNISTSTHLDDLEDCGKHSWVIQIWVEGNKRRIKKKKDIFY